MLYMLNTLLIFDIIFVNGKRHIFQHTTYPIRISWQQRVKEFLISKDFQTHSESFNTQMYLLSFPHLSYRKLSFLKYIFFSYGIFQNLGLLSVWLFPSHLSSFSAMYLSSYLFLSFNLFLGPQIENEILGLSSVYHCLNAWRWWVKQHNQWNKPPVHCSYCKWCSLWLFKTYQVNNLLISYSARVSAKQVTRLFKAFSLWGIKWKAVGPLVALKKLWLFFNLPARLNLADWNKLKI